MAVRIFQQAFNGGLMSPSMFGRISDPKYQNGLAVARNVLIEPQGPVRRRPGFVYVNTTKTQDAPCRLVPFVYNDDQTMVLEFGDGYIRFHTEGQTLLDDDGEPYEVETPYAVEDVMDIHYVQSADVMTLVHPAYRPRELKRYSTTDWRLEEIEFNEQLDSPTNVTVEQSINDDVSNPEDYVREYGVTALLEDGTQESLLSETVSIDCNPYGDGAYNTISWDAVDGAEIYRVYRNQGGVYAYVGQTSETSIIDENLTPDGSITPPYYSYPFTVENGIESVEVTEGGSGYSPDGAVTDIETSPAKVYATSSEVTETVTVEFTQDDIVRATKYSSSGSPGGFTSTSGSGAEISGSVTFSINTVKGTAAVDSVTITAGGDGYTEDDFLYVTCTYTDYDSNSDGAAVSSTATAEAWFQVTAASSTTTATITDPTGSGARLSVKVTDGVVTAITVLAPGSGYTDPVVVISDSNGTGAEATATVGTDTQDCPSAVGYHEQRRIFSGTYNYPLAVWMTYSGTESSFRYSLPTTSADRIEKKIFSRTSSRIYHVVELSSLMLLSAENVWVVSTVNDDAVTNDSLTAKAQSTTGASNVQPVSANNVMIYAAARGGHLQECGYNWQAGGFISQDVSVRAPALFDNYEILDMTISRAPWQVVWAVSSAGNLIAMTYVPEQSVGAFSSIETDGTFCSCCAVAEGTEDRLYCVIRREINGEEVYFIERMYQITYESLESCCFVDCAGFYEGTATARVTGLDWLEGEEVSILADGAVEPAQTVEDGTLTLESESSVVVAGLPYNSDIQTLPAAIALQDGSYGNSHQKNIRRVTVRTVDSSGLAAGPSFEKLTEYPARMNELAGSPPDTVSGMASWAVSPTWSQEGQVCIRQSYPLPMRIVSLTTTVEIA